MNDLYFACKNCKVFVDAGYRWAYWTLEQPGIVKRKEVIVAEVVLSAEEYWNPDLGEGSNWLYKGVLLSVREFLAIHREHEIIFGEYEDFISWDDESFLEWKQLGYLLTSLPRYFVEELKFKSWDEVCEYIEQRAETLVVGTRVARYS
ncbi:hypothetical protein H6F43_10085 [Leptolyngbya sp. FACHB-36]|uniref:hypothetical protein n=1 Tax=Leptolyngbya sp. FACHB-36 TaxID=2692808 RepID=UPI001680C529|nr:hypothetical protein [Leptolyngbya sp. FACHB-36]MBD2020536.1 hypothetical protein [Leptolyngbya sp. FACHB-36]